MTAPTVLNRQYDTAGNLVSISWKDWAPGTDGTASILGPLRKAAAEMKGPVVFMAQTAQYVIDPNAQKLHDLIIEGAAKDLLVYNGRRVRLSPQQALVLATLAANRGRIYTAKELVDVLYPDADSDVEYELNTVYQRMSALRKLFPDLIDKKRYVIYPVLA